MKRRFVEGLFQHLRLVSTIEQCGDNSHVLLRPTDVESLSFDLLVVCCASAVIAWLVGMLRPKGFGAFPAALWVSLLTVALLCSATIGVIEFLH
jgi:hypothetical protein